MQVTEIRELDKKRSRVYIDEEFAFVLYRSELRKFCIKEGEEISQEVHDEITRVILPKRAKLRAMNLLKSRQYSENSCVINSGMENTLPVSSMRRWNMFLPIII